MPRAKTFLTASEYAVLGLLRRRPAHGYDLQRHLVAGSGLGRVCPVEPAMVYAILKSLSGLELIDGEWDRSEYPPKAIYAITAEGEAEFQRWLLRPVSRMREVRNDFLAKLYFALEEQPGLARRLIASQIEACDSYSLDITRQAEAVESMSFDSIVLASKASAAESTRAWLQESLVALAAGED